MLKAIASALLLSTALSASIIDDISATSIPEGQGHFYLLINGKIWTSPYASLMPAGTDIKICKSYISNEPDASYAGITLIDPDGIKNMNLEFSISSSQKLADGVYQTTDAIMPAGNLCPTTNFLHNVKSTFSISSEAVDLSYTFRCNKKTMTQTYRCSYLTRSGK